MDSNVLGLPTFGEVERETCVLAMLMYAAFCPSGVQTPTGATGRAKK